MLMNLLCLDMFSMKQMSLTHVISLARVTLRHCCILSTVIACCCGRKCMVPHHMVFPFSNPMSGNQIYYFTINSYLVMGQFGIITSLKIRKYSLQLEKIFLPVIFQIQRLYSSHAESTQTFYLLLCLLERYPSLVEHHLKITGSCQIIQILWFLHCIYAGQNYCRPCCHMSHGTYL